MIVTSILLGIRVRKRTRLDFLQELEAEIPY